MLQHLFLQSEICSVVFIWNKKVDCIISLRKLYYIISCYIIWIVPWIIVWLSNEEFYLLSYYTYLSMLGLRVCEKKIDIFLKLFSTYHLLPCLLHELFHINTYLSIYRGKKCCFAIYHIYILQINAWFHAPQTRWSYTELDFILFISQRFHSLIKCIVLYF